MLTFGPQTRFGHIQFEDGFRNLILYDSERSFAADDPNCVLGIWERDALLDFNQVVVTESATDPKKFNIMLI